MLAACEASIVTNAMPTVAVMRRERQCKAYVSISAELSSRKN